MKLFTTKSLFHGSWSRKALAFAVGLAFAGGVNAQQTTPPSGVCTPTHGNMANSGCNNNWGFHFLKVGLNNWSHNVQCNTSTIYRYWNNLGNVGTLSQGATYTFTAQTASTTYVTSAGVWIDYNQDGNFDASEYLGFNTTGSSAPTFNGSFTVPCSAKPGQTLIRFRCDYATTLGSNRGCAGTNNNYGETMDYIVTIAGSSAPTANFSVPDTVYANSPALFVNSNQIGYVSHEWDVIGQGNNPDATTINYNGTFSTPGTYQLKLSSTNCNGTATTTKSFDVVNPTSSPQANFVVSQNTAVYDGSNPIYVDYFDLTQFGPTSWEWVMTPDWLNGAPFIWLTNNFDQNPSAFFYDVETYDVCLIVANSAGYDTLCRYSYIEITNPTSGSTFENVLGQNAGSTLDSGFIYDSGGDADPYSSNEFYQFAIEPCGAASITLNFHTFNLGSGDNLKVYEGNDNSGTLLGTFSGTNLPNAVTSNSSAMFLEWISDANTTGPGFKASWSATTVNNGAPVADFIIADTVYACSGGNDVEFINSSTGIVPGQASYDWIFDYDPNVVYPPAYADAKDEENPSWSYMSNGTYNVRMVLKSCEGNDTVVKTFVIANTTNLPIMDFTTSETILKVGQTSTLRAWGIASCDQAWVITPNTYEIENGGDSTDVEITVKFTAPGSYSVRCYGINDNGNAYKERTNHIEVIDYCKPAVTYPTVADVGIVNFELEDIMNETDAGKSPGYFDYTSTMGTALTLGETYSFFAERATTVNNVNFKIWLDYNRDGIFSSNELIANEVNSNAGTFTGNFTVPGLADVVPGETRMRVAVGLANTNLSACGPNQVGEYEDYTIMLTEDDLAPVITMIGNDTIIEINTQYMDGGAMAWDNIEGDITARIDVNINIDTAQAGIYFVRYNVMDLSGNEAAEVIRRVQVVEDLTKPTLTLTGANPLLWSVLVPYVDPGYAAVDMPSGANVDNLVIMSGSVDENMIGNYTITYDVTDAYGNSTTETRIVEVRDTTAPKIEGPDTVMVQVGVAFNDPITASDNFDNTVMPTVESGFVMSNAIGTYTQTYSVMDASGNKGANRTIVFVVADYIAPTIRYTPGTETVIVNVFDNNWEKAPGLPVTADDNYYQVAQLVKKYSAGFDVNVVGTYTITYEATDKAGNMSSFVRTVIVRDAEKPIVVTQSLNLPRWSTYNFTDGVAVIDNYYAPSDFANATNGCLIEIIRSNVDFDYPGIYQVTYVATDGSGNRSDETVRIVQIGDEGPNTGVDAFELSNAINLYPNPNSGVFTLEITTPLKAGASIEVINAVGEVVYMADMEQFATGKADINLTGIAVGVYYVRVSNAGQTATRKVVITK